MYYVYILHSEKDGKLYTGSCPDLKSRMFKHNNGFVLSTKNRRPLKLVYYEAFVYPEDARGREKFLKGGQGKQEVGALLKKYFKQHPWKK